MILIVVIIITLATFITAYGFILSDIESVGSKKYIDLDNEIYPSVDFIELMTVYGNNYYRNYDYIHEDPLFDYIEYDPATDSYSMDSLEGTEYEDTAVNITGQGKIPEGGMKRGEINLVFSLNKYFRLIHYKHPKITWIYYTSESRFVSMYPWISSSDFKYSDDLKDIAFYSIMTPENNSTRQALWTPVYQDAAGKGLMVTLSSPLYYNDEFKGVLSLDVTTDTLSEILNCNYTSYLIDTEDSIIAACNKVELDDQIVKINKKLNISDAHLAKLSSISNDSIKLIGGYYIYKHSFDSAPWSMIITESLLSIILKSLLISVPVIFISLLLLIMANEVNHRKQAEELVSEMARRDELTGLKNRNYLYSIIEKMMADADITKQKLAVSIFDLDHFKKVNDAYGHPIGDEVLRQTAQIAEGMIRKTDILVRLGGEEFMLLLPGTDITGAHEVAEKIRLALEKRIHPIAGKCTASFGVTVKTEGETFINLYKRVDEALYKAKDSGRNRVVTYEEGVKKPIASARLEWNNEWNSGDAIIDDEHKGMLSTANDLMYMSMTNEDADNIEKQIQLLIKRITDHFVDEEAMLIEIGYPNHEAHCRIHGALKAKALLFSESFRAGNMKSSNFFSFMVDDIILGHMLQEDVKFFEYIKKYNESKS
jgi:diguanylate cyclase (GGDEF)-like protein/hemerythrin-like metal-binding protein